MTEIEIKLRLGSDLSQTRRELRDIGFSVSKRRLLESNILFDDSKKSLRRQGKLIRLRQVGERSVLTFKGPSDRSRYKKREELEIDFGNAGSLEHVLDQMGYHPVFRYEKFRTEYSRPSCEALVLLDETPIGNFLEIEGKPRCIDRTAKVLGFSACDYIARSYGYLYLAYCRERRAPARNMVFKKIRTN